MFKLHVLISEFSTSGCKLASWFILNFYDVFKLKGFRRFFEIYLKILQILFSWIVLICVWMCRHLDTPCIYILCYIMNRIVSIFREFFWKWKKDIYYPSKILSGQSWILLKHWISRDFFNVVAFIIMIWSFSYRKFKLKFKF